MNIDFLRVGTHSKTEDYLDMLYSSNLLPVITKPTRITSHTATLIDHIYTNASTDQIIPGIVTTDISDHLPTFCFIRRQITRLKPKRFFRDYSNFDCKTYLNDIKSVDWSSILNDPTDIHTKASKLSSSDHRTLLPKPLIFFFFPSSSTLLVYSYLTIYNVNIL